MKFMVGYNGSSASKKALALACRESKTDNAMVYVVTSMVGGSGEDIKDIQQAEEDLKEAKTFLAKEQVDGETIQLVRGLSPGEDLVKFAEDNGVEHIFIGVEKISRARKILLGSTAQYVILKGPCPVTTVK